MALSRAEINKRYRERHPERVRAARRKRPSMQVEYGRNFHLKKRYGITSERFDEILVEQHGRCAICGADEPGGRGTWHVDHDHKTGEVRGLLCYQCNNGLGRFKDSPTLLKAAAFYLQRGKRH